MGPHTAAPTGGLALAAARPAAPRPVRPAAWAWRWRARSSTSAAASLHCRGTEALGGPRCDGAGGPARLDLGVQALVLQQRGRAGLEEDLGALLFDHLVVLGWGGGHREFERRLRRERGGDPKPRAVGHLRCGDEAPDGLGRVVADRKHAAQLLRSGLPNPREDPPRLDEPALGRPAARPAVAAACRAASSSHPRPLREWGSTPLRQPRSRSS